MSFPLKTISNAEEKKNTKQNKKKVVNTPHFKTFATNFPLAQANHY